MFTSGLTEEWIDSAHLDELINDALMDQRDPLADSGAMALYDVVEEPVTESLPAVTSMPMTSTKVCHACGMSVDGRLRYKDQMGYWCVDCHHADAHGHGRAALANVSPEVARELDQRHYAEIAKRQKEGRMVRLQLLIALSAVVWVVALYRCSGLFAAPHSDAAGNDARDLMNGGLIAGATVLAMIGGFVFWLKRQV